MKPIRHFWEGRDSTGRPVRATLVIGPSNLVMVDAKFPVVVWRGEKKWKASKMEMYAREEWVEVINEANRASGTKLKPKPRSEGIVWPVIAIIPLSEIQQCLSYRTPIGLEPKFRPSMARLPVESFGSFVVALDAWLHSDGKRSIAKQLVQENAHGTP